MDQLEKIDLLKERLGVSYQDAYRALEQTGGDVVQALIYLEGKGQFWNARLGKSLEKVGQLIAQGNATRVRLKKGDRVIGEVPATVGVAGVMLMLVSPVVAVVGGLTAIAGLAGDYHFEVVKIDQKKVVVPIVEE